MPRSQSPKSKAAFVPIPEQERPHDPKTEESYNENDDLGHVFEGLGKSGQRGRIFFCGLIVVSAALIFFAK